MKRFKNKLFARILILSLIACMSVQTFAYTVIPGFPDSSQTTGKLWCAYSAGVDDVRKNANSLIAYGTMSNVGGGILGEVASSFPLLRKVTIVAGGAVAIYGIVVAESLRDFSDNAKIVSEVYFKWVDADRGIGTVTTNTYVKYNGERISEVDTTSYTKNFFEWESPMK